jgi:predicted RNA-binding protein with TRAM domain
MSIYAARRNKVKVDMYRQGNRDGGFSRGPSIAPVKVGEELTATVEAVGEKGDGICKKNGFVLFVPGVKEGQSVRIRVTKVLRKVGFAEVVGDAPAASEEASKEEPKEETTPAASEDGEASEDVEDSDDFGEDGENN